MGERAERVTIAKGPVLKQVVLPVDLIQFFRDFTTASAGSNQLKTPLVHRAVDLPQGKVRITAVIEEQGPLERLVVPRDHRKTVKAQDVAFLYPSCGQRIVGAIRVDSGLKPGPGVH